MSSFLGELRDVLTRGDDLPTLPAVVFELHGVLENENTSQHEVTAVIQRDPALATRLLRLANSATFNRGSPVGSVDQAVRLLGLKQVGALCIALSVVNAFNQGSGRLDHASFWEHSAGVALAAVRLAESCGSSQIPPEQLYVGGLLHDIGLLLLDQYFSEWLRSCLAHAGAQSIALHDAEADVLGIDHGEIGGLLLGSWSLPHPIVAMVTHHHHPGVAPAEHKNACCIIHASETMCGAKGPSLDVESHDEDPTDVLHALDTHDADIDAIFADLTAEASVFAGAVTS